MKYIVLIILVSACFAGTLVAKEAQPNEDPRIEQRMKALTEQFAKTRPWRIRVRIWPKTYANRFANR